MCCSAAMPWPMQSSVEAVMAQEGRVTVGKYLEYTKEACEEDRNNRAAGLAVGLTPSGTAYAPRAAALQGMVSDVDAEDTFFDAEDSQTQPEASSSQTSRGDGFGCETAAASEPVLVPYETLDRGEAVLRCLLQIHASCSETAVLMRQVQQSLQRMDENIGAIRAAATTAAKRPGWTGQSPAAGGTDGGAGPRQAGGSWMYLLCFGIAGASAASLVIVRARQARSSM